MTQKKNATFLYKVMIFSFARMYTLNLEENGKNFIPNSFDNDWHLIKAFYHSAMIIGWHETTLCR